MRDKLFLLAFLVIAALLIYLGRNLLIGSAVVGQALAFAGVTGGAFLVLLLVRVRRDLQASRMELARKEAELSFAREVQEALFPKSYPRGGGLDYYGVCIPALGISGDYYDALELEGGRQAFAIADISGKGISAAILMANLQALLRREARGGLPPEELCRRLNRHLCEVTPPASFATFFYGEWDCPQRRLRYVNAGHNRPLLLQRDSCRELKRGGLPLGIFEDSEYETGSVRLAPGDLILLYSDGVSESTNCEDREFGSERIVEAARRRRGDSLPALVEGILRQAHEFAGGEQRDDMTILAVRRVEEGREPEHEDPQ